MGDKSEREAVATAMRQINQAWLDGKVEELTSMVHPEIVACFGFVARAQGRQAFIDGFRDFIENATIHDFREHDHEIDVIGHTAVVTFRYAMVYERLGERYHATGRDLWVFGQQVGKWLAVWRTMLDVEENAA